MFFDRYEIHIQAFVDFINGKLIIFQSSSPQKHIFKYILKLFFFKKYFPKNNAQLQVEKIKKSLVFEFCAPKIMKF